MWNIVVDNVSDSKEQIHDKQCRAFQDSTGHTYLKKEYKTEAPLTETKAIFFQTIKKTLAV